MLLHRLLGILLLFFCYANLSAQPSTVFENGEGGYTCFRIPAIIKAPNGTLLAFAEGRVTNCGDFGNVDIVQKVSSDNGKTWGALRVVASNTTLQAGNPTPIVDLLDPNYPKGRIFLIYNTGNASEQANREGKGVREVLYITSTDNGQTWTIPITITTSVHRPNNPQSNQSYTFKEDWRSYANTPGHGLQLTKGKYQGRLLVPANHSEGPPQKEFRDYHAHAFYSDDHGATWKLSNVVEYPGSNESTAAELSDGSVLMNMRNQSGDQKYRLTTRSTTGGSVWEKAQVETQLPDPVCEGSILSAKASRKKSALFFSNLNNTTKRENLTLYTSTDDGKSWQVFKVVDSGSSAYSDLVQPRNGHIGILYEKDDYRKVVYVSFGIR
jgi:sialidase-1